MVTSTFTGGQNGKTQHGGFAPPRAGRSSHARQDAPRRGENPVRRQDQRSARGVERQHGQVQFLDDGILHLRNTDRESVGSGTLRQSPFRGVVLQGEDRIHAQGASGNAPRLTSCRRAITRGPAFALAPFHL